MCDDFDVNNGGATPDIAGTKKVADGAPAWKRCCLGDGAERYCVAFGWWLIPDGNKLGELLLEGSPAALNLWLKSGDTNEGGVIGIVGKGSGILSYVLNK